MSPAVRGVIEFDQRLSENLDEDIIEDEDNNELVKLDSEIPRPRLGSTKNGSDMLRPTLLSESLEAPVILSPFFGVLKKSFLSTKGFEVPVPRGSRSVNIEARS